MLEDTAAGGFWDAPEGRAAVRRAIEERAQRADAYA